jgi:flagellum-specific ATP synthase
MRVSSRVSRYLPLLRDIEPIKAKGLVEHVIGLSIAGKGPAAPVGDLCDIYTRSSCTVVKAEVVGFKGQRLFLMPLGEMRGIQPGSMIAYRGEKARVQGTPALRGRVLDGLGAPIDKQGSLPSGQFSPLYAQPPNPLSKTASPRHLTSVSARSMAC